MAPHRFVYGLAVLDCCEESGGVETEELMASS